MQADLNIILRLIVALILAGVLGWEREKAGKAAGIRTHMLVGFGSALFVIIGEIFISRYHQADQTMRFDPIRIVEAIVTGISFLVSCTIFVVRGKQRV